MPTLVAVVEDMEDLPIVLREAREMQYQQLVDEDARQRELEQIQAEHESSIFHGILEAAASTQEVSRFSWYKLIHQPENKYTVSKLFLYAS